VTDLTVRDVNSPIGMPKLYGAVSYPPPPTKQPIMPCYVGILCRQYPCNYVSLNIPFMAAADYRK